MYQLIFRNWKFALLWAIGLSASVGAFFADGGRHEQLEANVEKIREQRSHGAPTGITAGQSAPVATMPLDEESEAAAVGEDDDNWGQLPA